LEILDAAASAALIEHRLVKAGKLPVVEIFAPDALECAVNAGDGLARRLTNVVRCAMVEAADRGAEVVLMDHVIAALRAREMKTATPRMSAALSISEDIGTQEKLRVEHRTFFARVLDWFP
jgi:hypothetical protein